MTYDRKKKADFIAQLRDSSLVEWRPAYAVIAGSGSLTLQKAGATEIVCDFPHGLNRTCGQVVLFDNLAN